MDLQYDTKSIEQKWQQWWEKHKTYCFDQKSKKLVFSIDTPPPTLSGAMHIGHAFSYSHGDFIARYHRMIGENVLYPFGTDDNGLATNILVEKITGTSSITTPRDKFITLATHTIKKLQPDFIHSWKNLGISCDFHSPYSTINNHCRKTAQLSFIDLYTKGRVYAADTPVAWCTTCQTAIAQAEFTNKNLESNFYDIAFTAHGKPLPIATTRPELIPACVAVLYHPDDKKYAHLKGAFAAVPLFGYEVPLLPDPAVDPAKGTGIVMCCTYGDKTDIEWWYKYKLQTRVIIAPDGTLNETAGPYKNMKVKEARKAIIHDLEKKELLLKTTPLTHAVNLHERCHTEIEFIKTKQWYIKILDKKQELIDAADTITWHPAFMKTRYIHWVENLQWDWCISRQRHFGIPFPLWTCEHCDSILLADTKNLPIDPVTSKPPKQRCSCGGTFIGEHDVMDTWATSSLTPQIVLNWAENTKIFPSRFPMNLRMQAHDIIRTWAFYTIVKAVFSHNTIPWKNIMISGYVTMHGEKMSKSKGNVVDPATIIEKYGADALRYWAAGGKLGADLDYMEKDLVTGKKMITKLWNASRFVLEHLKDYNGKKPKKLEVIDADILSRLQDLVRSCRNHFTHYEYSHVRTIIDDFFWSMFCDHYIEAVKDRLYNPKERGKDARTSGQYTLFTVLSTLLKLLAPLMPYITEEIYSSYFSTKEKSKSIHLTSYPAHDATLVNEKIEKLCTSFYTIVNHVRKAKTEAGKSLSTPIKLTLPHIDVQTLNDCIGDLKAVTKAQDIIPGKRLEVTF